MPYSQLNEANQAAETGSENAEYWHDAVVGECQEIAEDFRSVSAQAREINAVIREYLANGGKFSHGVIPLSPHI